MSVATVAVPVRWGEDTCVQFLRAFAFSSSPLACAHLPWVQATVHTVRHTKTIGTYGSVNIAQWPERKMRPFQFYPQNCKYLTDCVWFSIWSCEVLTLIQRQKWYSRPHQVWFTFHWTARSCQALCFCVFNMQNCTLLFPIHLVSSLLTSHELDCYLCASLQS